jgi:formate/nitrite transporter FocA (FNT family)
MNLKNNEALKEHLLIFSKAIMSGLYVVLAATVYLVITSITGSKLLGGLLFSFALLIIVGRSYYLYTGKIGYLLPYKKGVPLMILVTLIGNVVGIVLSAGLLLLANIDGLTESAQAIMAIKFDSNAWYETLVLAIFCGVLMYTAVDGASRIKDNIIKVLIIILSVVIFLLIGFEHSIANIVYIVLAKQFSLKIFGYLLLMLLGNAIGAIVLNLIHTPYYKEKETN